MVTVVDGLSLAQILEQIQEKGLGAEDQKLELVAALMGVDDEVIESSTRAVLMTTLDMLGVPYKAKTKHADLVTLVFEHMILEESLADYAGDEPQTKAQAIVVEPLLGDDDDDEVQDLDPVVSGVGYSSPVAGTSVSAEKPEKPSRPRIVHPVVWWILVICAGFILLSLGATVLIRGAANALQEASATAVAPAMQNSVGGVNGAKAPEVAPTAVPAMQTAPDKVVEAPPKDPERAVAPPVVSAPVGESSSLAAAKAKLSPAEVDALKRVLDNDVAQITQVGAGQQIILNWTDRNATMLLENDLEYRVFYTLSSDAGTLNGTTFDRGYVAVVLFQPGETLDLSTGFNESNGHYNLWAERYRVPQSMDLAVAAREMAWQMQGRENKDLVIFLSSPDAEPQILLDKSKG